MNRETIENKFTYHAPKAGQPQKYEQIRDAAKQFALLLNELCPESAETLIAAERLEECVMWAKALIARNE
jgi:hypothetical protein